MARRLRQRGADVGEKDVIITSGAQQALDLAVGLLFERGNRIVCDQETYPGALDLFRGKGMKPVVERDGAAGIYVMPEVTNPRGDTMDDHARDELVRYASGWGTTILEDDAYADLHFDGPAGRPLLARDRHRVWHVGTLSKSLCPGLRVGWLVPPRARLEAAIDSKRQIDLQSNSLSQAILADFLGNLDFDGHTAKSTRFYARRARALACSIHRHLGAWRFRAPRGGFAIWAETDGGGDDASLLEFALKQGVSIDPGSSFRLDPATRTIALRLSFSTEPAKRIEEGVVRLARAWRAFVRAT